MKLIASATITSCLAVLQFCQTAIAQAQTDHSGVSLATSTQQGEPILRGMENGSPFTTEPAEPNKAVESKPDAAPGADAIMTQDMMLVSPKAATGANPPRPLQAFVGQSLTLKIEKTDVTLDDLQGALVLVVNETNRPLVIDGDNARAMIGDKPFNCAPLIAIQRSVLPVRGGKAMAAGIFTKVLPATATVGLDPTIKDIIRIKQPIRMRYGPDELRRLAEQTRFGERILWPNQKTQGVVYFAAGEQLSGAKIIIPVHTLFDPTDTTLLSGNL